MTTTSQYNLRAVRPTSRSQYGTNGLGAEEILRTNPKHLNFKGYKPTYKLLADYSHLIDKSDGLTLFQTWGGVPEALKVIDKVIRTYYKQTSRLSQHLKAETLDQTCFNVWHWMITNIPFKNDTIGHEEIRTPSRAYSDRFRGIDCDCYTVLASSILLNLQIVPRLHVVGFNGSTSFQHIYAVVTSGANEYIIDGVMKEFNLHPRNITKRYIMSLSVEILSGIPSGLPAHNLPLEVLTGENKLRFANIAALADGITKNGHLSYKRNPMAGMLAGAYIAQLEALDNFRLNGLNGIAISGEVYDLSKAYINYDYANQVLGIRGLGEIASIFSKIKDAAKKVIEKTVVAPTKFIVEKTVVAPTKAVAKATVAVTKKVVEATKAVVKKSIDLIKKATTFIPRLAMIGLLKLNIFKMSSKMYGGYLTQAEAADYGFDQAEWEKLVKAKNSFESFWIKAGGSASGLKDAIMNGRGGKIFKRNNPLVESETGSDAVQGIGVVVAAGTAASVASSTPFWKSILNYLKGVDFKKMLSKVDVKKLAGDAKAAKEALESMKSAPTTLTEKDINNAQNSAENDPEYTDAVSTEMDKENINLDAQSNTNQTGTNTGSGVSLAGGSMLIPIALAAGVALLFILKK